MAEESNGVPLVKAGEPRERLCPKPIVTHEKPWKEFKPVERPVDMYCKKRKQEVLLWLIEHRIEDREDNATNAERLITEAAPGVEKKPRRNLVGSDRWLREPTFLEAAKVWNIPLGTIASWWEEKEAVFDGVVPESALPLVHRSQRSRPKAPSQPTPDLPGPMPRSVGPPLDAGHIVWQAQPPAPYTHQPVPRLDTASVIYPQAAQPSGPPLHPLYRANFALGEVSKEVSHMIQHQQNLYLENLLRAIALSQALVNDLTEAHKVLLDPQSYPQYYPPGAYPQPPQHQQWSGPPLQPPPSPHPPPGPYPRTGDGRFIAIQPAPFRTHPLTPVHTPNTQTFPQQQYQPLPPQTGQQAGQHKWRLGTNSHAPTSRAGHQPTRPTGDATANQEGSSRFKRSYSSKDGPGGTAELPIVLEDCVNGTHRAKTAGPGKRRGASRAGPNEETATGHRLDKRDGSNKDENDLGARDRSVQRFDEVSNDEQGMPLADTDSVEHDEANAIKQSGPTTAEQERTAKQQDHTEDAIEGGRDDEVPQVEIRELRQRRANGSVVSDAKYSRASQCTASEDRSQAEMDEVAAAAPEISSTTSKKFIVDEKTTGPSPRGEAAADEPQREAHQKDLGKMHTTTKEPTAGIEPGRVDVAVQE